MSALADRIKIARKAEGPLEPRAFSRRIWGFDLAVVTPPQNEHDNGKYKKEDVSPVQKLPIFLASHVILFLESLCH